MKRSYTPRLQCRSKQGCFDSVSMADFSMLCSEHRKSPKSAKNIDILSRTPMLIAKEASSRTCTLIVVSGNVNKAAIDRFDRRSRTCLRIYQHKMTFAGG